MLGGPAGFRVCKCDQEISKPGHFRPNPLLDALLSKSQGVHLPMAGANTRQVGGNHYKTGGEEHWDRVARLKLDYFQGQITKYVERCWRKNGVEDLKKARHFLDKYIEVATLRGEAGQGAEPGQGYVDQDPDSRRMAGDTISQSSQPVHPESETSDFVQREARWGADI